MKKLFLVIFLSVACSAFAQDIMSEFEAYKNQQNAEFKKFISNGSYYSEPVDTKPIDTSTTSATPKTAGIQNYKDYKAAFDSYIEKAEEQFTIFTAPGFNPQQYAAQAADLDEGSFNAYYIQIMQKDGVYSVSYRITYNDDYKVLKAWRDPSFKSKLSDNEKILYNEATSVLSRITDKNMSDFNKVLAIHDYLVLNVTYDKKAVSNPKANPNSFKAYGAMLEKNAVCDGYTKSMNLLGNMAEVKTVKVNGTSGKIPHSWNKIVIGGDWYNVDVTFDDPSNVPANVIYYDYFNVADSLLQADHIWIQSKYPAATASKYNYFVYNGLVANNYSQFTELVKGRVNAGKNKYISVYLTDYSEGGYPLDFIRSMGLKNLRYNVPAGKSGVFTLIYD